jgi:hypothetical protein
MATALYGAVKTTVEIDDDLLRQAKLRAVERGETLHALLERGLRRELEATHPQAGGYELRDASVGGGWIKPEFLPWHSDNVRPLAHEDPDS